MSIELTENASQPKPENVPDKFWDAGSGQIRIDELLRSYLELEKKLSAMVSRPTNDEEKMSLLRNIGAVPETPDGYEINISHGVFEPDVEVNRRLHEKGFTCDQVQEVYDLAAEKMVPLIAELANNFQKDREKEKLIEFFGGKEQWHEVSRQLLAFGTRNMPEDVLESLSSTADGVIALYRMMETQDPSIIGGGGNSVMPNDEESLNKMMRDPKYWRDRDPAFVSEVTKGFEQLYS